MVDPDVNLLLPKLSSFCRFPWCFVVFPAMFPADEGPEVGVDKTVQGDHLPALHPGCCMRDVGREGGHRSGRDMGVFPLRLLVPFNLCALAPGRSHFA